MAGTLQVDVQVAERLEGVPDTATIRLWLEQAIRHTGTLAGADVEVSVKVVGEVEGRSLNRQYRQQDHATNVLSFPLLEAGQSELPAGPPVALGDIVICGPVVAREARERHLEADDHWAHLLVHGVLHLLGYDHQTDEEADEMETLERRILAAGGVADPYVPSDAAGARP